jgi:hypothetical protein
MNEMAQNTRGLLCRISITMNIFFRSIRPSAIAFKPSGTSRAASVVAKWSDSELFCSRAGYAGADFGAAK